MPAGVPCDASRLTAAGLLQYEASYLKIRASNYGLDQILPES
jgi:hypothetical protein